MPTKTPIRHLVLVLGDQLDRSSAALDDFDMKRDVIWMAEVREEATHVWSTKMRTAVFLACMRHFRDEMRDDGRVVDYRELEDQDNQNSLAGELKAAVKRHKPEKLIVVQPGDYRVRESLKETAAGFKVPLEERADRHFLVTPEEFAEHAEGRKSLRMEFFYREVRRKLDVLMDESGDPVGGKWNYDADNRGHFGKDGPQDVPEPVSFSPDGVTAEVLASVKRVFADHPGELDAFNWPVTPGQARDALADFVDHRLADFGTYQDAMWTGEPFLYHSRISSAMNLKLLDPREVVHAVEEAYHKGKVPLNAAEGYIRQVIGWREYVRGIYWLYMPEYKERNYLNADRPLPGFYWDADTDMRCLKESIGQTLKHGYAHHIQRLMVIGLFAMLLGVDPLQISDWYLAVYVDAVEWVELPNVTGMSQFADGGVMASKPYAASGKYIQRMSNYCKNCPYKPAESVGDSACPFTTLYWDFLMRHRGRLKGNQRMTMQLKNLDRVDDEKAAAIRQRAEELRIMYMG